jgi:hypothetical protein
MIRFPTPDVSAILQIKKPAPRNIVASVACRPLAGDVFEE